MKSLERIYKNELRLEEAHRALRISDARAMTAIVLQTFHVWLPSRGSFAADPCDLWLVHLCTLPYGRVCVRFGDAIHPIPRVRAYSARILCLLR